MGVGINPSPRVLRYGAHARKLAYSRSLYTFVCRSRHRCEKDPSQILTTDWFLYRVSRKTPGVFAYLAWQKLALDLNYLVVWERYNTHSIPL